MERGLVFACAWSPRPTDGPCSPGLLSPLSCFHEGVSGGCGCPPSITGSVEGTLTVWWWLWETVKSQAAATFFFQHLWWCECLRDFNRTHLFCSGKYKINSWWLPKWVLVAARDVTSAVHLACSVQRTALLWLHKIFRISHTPTRCFLNKFGGSALPALQSRYIQMEYSAGLQNRSVWKGTHFGPAVSNETSCSSPLFIYLKPTKKSICSK